MTSEASKVRRALAFCIDFGIGVSFIMLHRFWGTLVYFLYMLFRDYLLPGKGQSIGKSILRLHVISEDTPDTTPDLAQIIKRNITLLIPVLNLFDILALFIGEQKRLGDVLAGTKVICGNLPQKMLKQ